MAKQFTLTAVPFNQLGDLQIKETTCGRSRSGTTFGGPDLAKPEHWLDHGEESRSRCTGRSRHHCLP